MESSTNRELSQEVVTLFGQWAELEGKFDLEESAHRLKALVRRREIRSASDLLRMMLVYCMQDWSLRMMGSWAEQQSIGKMSDVAVHNRLRNSKAWLGELLYTCLEQRGAELAGQAGIKVRLRDATVITAPGSKGTDWRMHLKLDLGQRCISGVEVTDAHGGETLARLPIEAGEIQIGDRGYAFASGIGAILDQQAHVVVRINWQNLPLKTATGEKFGLIEWLQRCQGVAEQPVWLETPQGCFALRVLACPLAPQAAEEARRRARQAAHKKKHEVSEATLLAAGFLLLVSDLPQDDWPSKRVLWLYRLRWQIEIIFKTYKSLLHFDQLRSKDPQLAQAYLYGKILIVLLIEQLTQQVRLQLPDWFTDPQRPVSYWRLIASLREPLRQLLTGTFSFAQFWSCLPDLQRYVRCSPRSRPQLLAWNQAFLEHLSCSVSFF